MSHAVHVYRRLIHLGEERELVPSYAVWLAGCNFSCTFCSDAHAVRAPFPGKPMQPSELAAVIAEDLTLSKRRVRNINFVGGEPSINLPFIADTALQLAELMPQVPPLLLNTNGYLSEEALEGAIELFDLFVVDLKFGNDRCAESCGGPADYVHTLSRNLTRLGDTHREVWVRHLLMPGHLECCTAKVLGALEALSPAFKVNVMPAFVSFNKEWGRLSESEIERGRALLTKSEIRHKYWDGKKTA